MPIFEYACHDCRKIFQFLSRRQKTERSPVCPECGNQQMAREVSRFAMLKGVTELRIDGEGGEDMEGMPNFEDPRVQRAMRDMERDMAYMDENNPKHMAHMMRKMQDVLPPDLMPKEINDAIRRLEAGEDPDKIEEDMGELFDQFMGPEGDGGSGRSAGRGMPYTRDDGLYDM